MISNRYKICSPNPLSFLRTADLRVATGNAFVLKTFLALLRAADWRVATGDALAFQTPLTLLRTADLRVATGDSFVPKTLLASSHRRCLGFGNTLGFLEDCWLASSHRNIGFRTNLGSRSLMFWNALGFLALGFPATWLVAVDEDSCSGCSMVKLATGGGGLSGKTDSMYDSNSTLNIAHDLLAIMIECKYSISRGSLRTVEAFGVPTQCTSSSKKPKPMPE